MSHLRSVVCLLEIIATFILCRPFGSIIFDLSSKYEEISVADLRKLEKIRNKYVKSELDITFLKNCQTFHVFPKFLAFNIPHSDAHDSRVIRKRLLRSALHKRISQNKQLHRSLESEQSRIKAIVSSVDWFFLSRALSKSAELYKKKTITCHEKKLKSLTKNSVIPFSPHQTITNLSNYQLSYEEEDILKYGLNFGIPPKRISDTSVYTSFEMVNSFLQKNLKEERFSIPLKVELSHLAQSYLSSYKPSHAALKKHRILRNLRKNDSIMISKPDKGSGVVIINKQDYLKKMHELLDDTTKFMKVDSKVKDPRATEEKDITLFREGQLQRFLCKLKTYFPQDIYDEIYPTGSVPSRLYGLPKTHKMTNLSQVPPFRPICSSVGAYNHKLAKYLARILQPLLPDEYSVKDTFSFVSEIQAATISESYMVSFDVVSLFTNVPLEECISLAVDKILESKQLKMSRKNLEKLFRFCTSQTHFLFNGIYYDQIDGVCMGSPLGPVLANLFMAVREKEWIENCENSGLLLYKRYVDDIFCCFQNEQNAVLFLNYLNDRHPNIKFTLEKESDGILSFLDVKVAKSLVGFTTTTHVKPTNIGLLTNFASFVPFSYKIGLVKTLFDRALKICSCPSLLDLDIKRIVSMLMKNCFPRDLILKQLALLKQKKEIHSLAINQVQAEPRYFKLPFIGHGSKMLNSKLKSLIPKYCKQVNVKIIFESFKINTFFSSKDKIPEDLRSYSIYKFICRSCNAMYVGETHRHFLVRANEHLSTDKKSSVNKHLKSNPACQSECDISCFSVLDKADTKYKLTIKEAIHISRLKPCLNKQTKSYKIGLCFA